jgi:uncharacterized protein YfbU (UPF0304 family)
MQLSKTEKLILIMLADLLKTIDPKKRTSGVDPEFILEAVASNNSWAIATEYSMLLGGDDRPADLIDEVFDIMSMWREIEFSIGKFTAEQKAQLEARVGQHLSEPQFEGFDGNEEGPQYGAARFIVNKMGRFEEFAGRTLNSHHNVLGKYRAMLRAYNQLEHSGRDPLTVEQMATVIEARAR